jgi:hypothetical protein
MVGTVKVSMTVRVTYEVPPNSSPPWQALVDLRHALDGVTQIEVYDYNFDNGWQTIWPAPEPKESA